MLQYAGAQFFFIWVHQLNIGFVWFQKYIHSVPYECIEYYASSREKAMSSKYLKYI